MKQQIKNQFKELANDKRFILGEVLELQVYDHDQEFETSNGLSFRYKKYYKYKFILRYNGQTQMYELIELNTGYIFVQETTVKRLIDQMLKRFSTYTIKEIDTIIKETIDRVGTVNTMDTIKVI